jgi:TolA-binding protein
MKSLNFAVCSLILSTAACKTSGDLKGGDGGYDDPTQVQTIEAPDEVGEGAESAPVPRNVENLRRQLEISRGELENLRYASQQEIQQLRMQNGQLSEDNRKLSEEILKYRSGQQAAAPGPAAGTGGAQGAELLWKTGVQHLNQGKIQEGLSTFQSLITSYPKDRHVFGATLLSGMAQYRLGDHKAAALTFNQAIDRAPAKGVAPAVAWFGQGAAFTKLGQSDDAKLFFEETVRRYPQSQAAVLARPILARKAKAPDDLFKVFPRWPTYVP